MGQPLVAAQRGDAQALGHPVGHHDLFRAEQLEPGTQQRVWHHRGALQYPRDAGQIPLTDVGKSCDARQHRRRGGEVGDAIALDRVDNGCRIELFEHHQPVAAQQVGQRREAVGVIHRCRAPGWSAAWQSEPRRPGTGNDDSGVQTPCANVRITLGSPVDPLLHIPLALGDTTSGSGSADWPAARAVSACPVCVVDDDGRVDHLQHPGPLPIGQIPAHRHRNSADLPAAQRGQHQLLGVRNSQCDKRTDLSAGG